MFQRWFIANDTLIRKADVIAVTKVQGKTYVQFRNGKMVNLGRYPIEEIIKKL